MRISLVSRYTQLHIAIGPRWQRTFGLPSMFSEADFSGLGNATYRQIRHCSGGRTVSHASLALHVEHFSLPGHQLGRDLPASEMASRSSNSIAGTSRHDALGLRSFALRGTLPQVDISERA
jgi:hypothetical protein